jgi:hypothetical protein
LTLNFIARLDRAIQYTPTVDAGSPVKPGDDTSKVNGLVSQCFVVNGGVVQYTLPALSMEETHAFGS